MMSTRNSGLLAQSAAAAAVVGDARADGCWPRLRVDNDVQTKDHCSVLPWSAPAQRAAPNALQMAFLRSLNGQISGEDLAIRCLRISRQFVGASSEDSAAVAQDKHCPLRGYTDL